VGKIFVLNPEAPGPEAEETAVALRSLRESRVGVLKNQKQHAGLVMTRIVEELSKTHGVIGTAVVERPTSGPANKSVLDELAKSCDWVITGSAD
jgi:hypothetical protein